MKHWKLPLLLSAAMLAAACSSSGDTQEAASQVQLSAQVASYELVAGAPDRFLVGLFTDEGVVSYGTADLSFSYLGTGEASPEPGPSAEAKFLLVPQEGAGHAHEGEEPSSTATPMEDMDGMETEQSGSHDGDEESSSGDQEAPVIPSDEELAAAEARAPEITAPDLTRGVYQAEQVEFNQAGVWQAEVSIDIDGATASATAAFQVVDEPVYPFPGEPAPASENHLMNSEEVKPSVVDSRASEGWGSVPDPELHGATVADAIDRGRAAVVVVSTPLYCQSRFCGPITDEVQALAHEYEGVADFIHLEVWRNYQDKVVNEAAAEWVYRDDITEPWVFLVGSDGKILDRWANVMDVRDLRAELESIGSTQGGTP